MILWCFIPFATHGQTGFRIAAYNCENFFDCTHDSLKDDAQFLPHSPRRWTNGRYWKKLQGVSKVIASLSRHGAPPDVVALVEVENDSVLTALTRRALLRRLGYDYVMTRSLDPRGMDVALLYQAGTFRLLSHRAIRVDFAPLPVRPTRDILYVSGKTFTGDTLHFFVCHFSSQLDGRRFTEKYRLAEARAVRQAVDSIRQVVSCCNVVILGDFNEHPGGDAMQALSEIQSYGEDVHPPVTFCNLTEKCAGTAYAKGSYKYNGRWEMLDQILVSHTLTDRSQGLYTAPSQFSVHAPRFLLQWDERFGGYKPFRTYNGYRYQGGFSDHLPVFADFVEK